MRRLRRAKSRAHRESERGSRRGSGAPRTDLSRQIAQRRHDLSFGPLDFQLNLEVLAANVAIFNAHEKRFGAASMIAKMRPCAQFEKRNQTGRIFWKPERNRAGGAQMSVFPADLLAQCARVERVVVFATRVEQRYIQVIKGRRQLALPERSARDAARQKNAAREKFWCYNFGRVKMTHEKFFTADERKSEDSPDGFSLEEEPAIRFELFALKNQRLGRFIIAPMLLRSEACIIWPNWALETAR